MILLFRARTSHVVSSLAFLFALILFCFHTLHLQAVSAEEKLPAKIVLIVIDTLRADHLLAYGYRYDTAPFISELAKDSVVFEDAISPASYTAPATASIHTGLLPEQHGVLLGMKATRKVNKRAHAEEANAIADDALTLAEVFKDRGYYTVGIADNGNISETMGFDQGFDSFSTFNNKGADKIYARLSKLSQSIKEAEKLFLYLHFMDPHGPFIKREPWYRSKEHSNENSIVRLYNSEIGYVDHYIKKISNEFRLLDDSVIVITADHGEEFWEHGKQGHGKTLYQEVLHVPFIVYAPGRMAAQRFSPTVSTVDIFPTIVSMIDASALPKQLPGVNLREQLANPPQNTRPVISTLYRKLHDGREIRMHGVTQSRKRATERKDGSWKDSEGKTSERKRLFDLESDPLEKNNIYPANQTLYTSMIEEYERAHPKGSIASPSRSN